MCGDVHKNPGPRIAQWNCAKAMTEGNGPRRGSKLSTLIEACDVILAQELRCTPGQEPSIPGWGGLVVPHTQRSGGVGVFARPEYCLQLLQSHSDEVIQTLTVKITGRDADLTVCSVYWRPDKSSSIQAQHEEWSVVRLLLDDIAQRLQPDLLVGDVNAHHPSWSPLVPAGGGLCLRGGRLHEWITEQDDLFICNDPRVPTRVVSRGQSILRSSPDLTLAKAGLVTNWRTDADSPKTRGLSDHLPILFVVSQASSAKIPMWERKTLWNLKKADWESWTRETESSLTEVGRRPPDAARAERIFRDILSAASLKHIPRGCRKERSRDLHLITSDPVAMELHDRVRSLGAADDGEAYMEALDALHARRDHLKRSSFESMTAALTPTSGSAFRILRSMCTKAPPTSHGVPLTLRNNPPTQATKVSAKAEAFARYFSTLGKPSRMPYIPRPKTYVPVTDAEILASLDACSNGRAPGRDGIVYEMLQHLGPMGRSWLFYVVRRSVSTGTVPNEWKHAVVVPLPKPDKDLSRLPGFRPISLTSVLSKIAERVVASRLVSVIERRLHHSQFAYRGGLSTIDALYTAVDSLLHQQNTTFQGQGARSAGKSVVYSMTSRPRFGTTS